MGQIVIGQEDNKMGPLLRSSLLSLSFCTIFSNNFESIKKGIEEHRKAFLKFTSIETDRLIIRKMKMDDIDDIFCFTSDPEMLKFTPMYDLSKNKEGLSQYIKKVLKNYKDGNPEYWAVVYKKINKVIGIVTIDISSKHRGDIGYAICRKYWGKGFATEAAKAIIDFGFNTLGLKRIEGACDPRNIASVKVLKKLGMKYEGLLKSYSCMRGEFCDRKLYAIINS